jgi:hypothetical protein
MSAGLSTEALERLWLALSAAITAAGPEREAVFLAKLVLLLGQELGDEARIAALIETAQKDL